MNCGNPSGEVPELVAPVKRVQGGTAVTCSKRQSQKSSDADLFPFDSCQTLKAPKASQQSSKEDPKRKALDMEVQYGRCATNGIKLFLLLQWFHSLSSRWGPKLDQSPTVAADLQMPGTEGAILPSTEQDASEGWRLVAGGGGSKELRQGGFDPTHGFPKCDGTGTMWYGWEGSMGALKACTPSRGGGGPVTGPEATEHRTSPATDKGHAFGRSRS